VITQYKTLTNLQVTKDGQQNKRSPGIEFVRNALNASFIFVAHAKGPESKSIINTFTFTFTENSQDSDDL
jgi:hypothetical protein